MAGTGLAAGTLGLLGHATVLSGGLQEREGRTSEGGSPLLSMHTAQPLPSPQPCHQIPGESLPREREGRREGSPPWGSRAPLPHWPPTLPCYVTLDVSDSVRPHRRQPTRLPSLRFSRREYWSGLPCPPPGDLPDPEVRHISLKSPALAGGFSATWEALPAWRQVL